MQRGYGRWMRSTPPRRSRLALMNRCRRPTEPLRMVRGRVTHERPYSQCRARMRPVRRREADAEERAAGRWLLRAFAAFQAIRPNARLTGRGVLSCSQMAGLAEAAPGERVGP